MNPYRPGTVDAFDHVVHFSFARLMERTTALKSPSFPDGGDEKIGFGKKRDYISSFLEAKHLYPDLITDDNIVMYILTNVSILYWFSTGIYTSKLTHHIFPLAPTQ